MNLYDKNFANIFLLGFVFLFLWLRHMGGGGGVVFLSILLFRRETVRVSDLRLGQWGWRRSGLRLGAPMGASPPPLHRRPFSPLFVIFDNSWIWKLIPPLKCIRQPNPLNSPKLILKIFYFLILAQNWISLSRIISKPGCYKGIFRKILWKYWVSISYYNIMLFIISTAQQRLARSMAPGKFWLRIWGYLNWESK